MKIQVHLSLIIFVYTVLFQIYCRQAHAQDTAGGLTILPLAGYAGDQGFGVGAEVAWLKMQGTDWTLQSRFMYSVASNQTYLSTSFTNDNLGDVLYLSFGGAYFSSSHSTFYGFGNDTTLDFPNQYSSWGSSFYIRPGVKVASGWVVGLSGSQNKMSIDNGNDPSTPQYVSTFSSRPFVRGTVMSLLGLFATYDDRDSPYTPKTGTYFTFSYDQTQTQQIDELKMQKTSLNAEKVLPISGDDLIGVGRVRFERIWGGDTPFYAQSRLGGASTLRAYRWGRFTDLASVLYQAEGRWAFWKPGGFVQRVELSAGPDVGRVLDQGTISIFFESLRVGYDLGLTAVLGSGVPIRLDYGAGPDGIQLYAHLMYPF